MAMCSFLDISLTENMPAMQFLLASITKQCCWPVLMSVLWITYSTYGYALRNEVSTPLAVYENVQQYMNDEKITSPVIALVDFSEQFVLFSPYPIVHFGYNASNESQLSSAYAWQVQAQQFMLLDEKNLIGDCYDIKKSIDVGFAHRRHWLLIPLDAKNASCDLEGRSNRQYRYQLPIH